jgi:hypothetical protein
MGRFPTEEESLKAINKLQEDFPYAATLLIYTVLERCLKLHLLQKRTTLTDAEVNLDFKILRGAGPCLRKARDFDDATFIGEFLVNCSLGTLEHIYEMVPRKKYSEPRNHVFHSNLFFLSDQHSRDYPSRDEENLKYLQDAKAHLIEASKLYFRQEITESNGSLAFKT